MKNKRVISLLSGGIDSTTLLAKLSIENYEVIAISFLYGQKHQVELDYAKKNAQKYCVKKHYIIELDKMLFNSSALVNDEIDITTYEDDTSSKEQVNAYVPFRNLLFISATLSLAETINIDEVYVAFNKDDSSNFWDCNTNFVEKINAIIPPKTAIQVKTPFINLTKKQIIRLAQRLNVDLEDTITCYQPNQTIECGICLSCIAKQKALTELW